MENYINIVGIEADEPSLQFTVTLQLRTKEYLESEGANSAARASIDDLSDDSLATVVEDEREKIIFTYS